MSRMRKDFELLVNLTSLVRFLLIVGVLLVNLISLIKLIFGSRSNWPSYFCVHRVTTGLILAANLAYQSTWLPYLIWSSYNGRWPFLSSREHCIIQYSVTNHVITLLLTVLTIQKIYDYFRSTKARFISYSLVLGWIIPQCVYISLIDLINPEKSSYQFLERLLYTPNHLTSASGWSHSTNIGFMLCITKLASPIVAQLSWHYLVLVIPLTALIFTCSVAGALKNRQGKTSDSYCYCPRDLAVLLSLYFNIMWLIILRPLIILQTLIMAKDNDETRLSPNYLDFGTHLVLIFSSLLVPFSTYGGFRSSYSVSSTFSSSLSLSSFSCDHDNRSISDSDGSQCSSSLCQQQHQQLQQQQQQHQQHQETENSIERY